MDNNYQIIIKSEIGGGKSKMQVGGAKADEGTSATNGIQDIWKKAKSIGVVAIGAQIVSYATSRVGVETGNQQLQDEINGWTSVVKKSIAIGGAFLVNPILGFTALASTAVSFGTQAHTFNYEHNMENIALKQVRERGGISLNRSRREFQ